MRSLATVVGTRRVSVRPLLALATAVVAGSLFVGAEGCASSPGGDKGAAAGAAGRGPGGEAAGPDGRDGGPGDGDAGGAETTPGVAAGRAGGGRALETIYPGFLPGTFATEPVALLRPVRIELPGELQEGPDGRALVSELERIVLDRLPEELRILHSRAPVYAFDEWAGRDGITAGELETILAWSGAPGAAGELPPEVGNAVEAIGDGRGVRWFLFPRALTIRARGPFHHAAAIEAYLLDARGERAVWAGTGTAEGRLPERGAEGLLRSVVLDAARGAAADLARRVPGSGAAGGDAGFSDQDAGATREVR